MKTPEDVHIRPSDVDWSATDPAYFEELLERAAEQCEDIQEQLDASRRRTAKTGRFTDTEWYTAAERALRRSKRLRQRLMQKAADARRSCNKAGRRDQLEGDRLLLIEAVAASGPTTRLEVIERLEDYGRCADVIDAIRGKSAKFDREDLA